MKPEDANTRNCKVVRVVYNDGDFSIAYLYLVDKKENTLGVRWNYNYTTDNPVGSPNQGNTAKWLYYTDKLLIPTLNAIAGLPDTNEEARSEVLKAFQNGQIIKP